MSDALRQAAQAALDAWDRYETHECLRGWMDMLRAALAEPAPTQAEPVAWLYRTDANPTKWSVSTESPDKVELWNDIAEWKPLYLAAPTIPHGWRLVPVEPTEEMITAARDSHEGEAYLPVSLYKAMLAAAPAPGGEHE